MADIGATEAVPDQSTPAPVADASDPFSLDESKFISLSPEQRAALDPIFNEWKTKARGEIERSTKTWKEKYEPVEKESQALRELVRDQRFQQWWQATTQQAAMQNPMAAGGNPAARPSDFASPQEWQEAILEGSNGDATKMQAIQARMFHTLATPVVKRIEESQKELRQTFEMKDLWERHPDAKDLDGIGRDPANPNDSSESLLESCLNWAEANGKTFEDGYLRARKWADSLKVGAKQEAMGLVESKKQSVTSGPSTSKGGAGVVEVADGDELMQKNMEYLAAGEKPPKFVIRRKEATGERWSSKT